VKKATKTRRRRPAAEIAGKALHLTHGGEAGVSYGSILRCLSSSGGNLIPKNFASTKTATARAIGKAILRTERTQGLLWGVW
jgi:hypothetical protein